MFSVDLFYRLEIKFCSIYVENTHVTTIHVHDITVVYVLLHVIRLTNQLRLMRCLLLGIYNARRITQNLIIAPHCIEFGYPPLQRNSNLRQHQDTTVTDNRTLPFISLS